MARASARRRGAAGGRQLLTSASAPYDLSYLYDAAAAPGRQLTTLILSSAAGDPTL